MRNVLLLEPNYKNKFPPIGLMKLSTYFRMRGDNVVFYKGNLQDFLIHQITDDCVEQMSKVDSSINWRFRADKIFMYIKTRKAANLEKIGIEDSEYKSLLYPCVELFKNEYWKKEYLKHPKWDWVCVTTLFTFYWDITIETINFAKTIVKNPAHIMVGGVLASIQPDEIEEATGIRPHCGTLHTPGEIDKGDPYIIDELPLDYSILGEIDYEYADGGDYYSYSTRGCIRKCPFCAVRILEPRFIPYIPLYERIERTRRLYGEQHNLLLMDNNVLASPNLEKIIEDIKKCGFTHGAKFIEPNQYKLAIRNLRLGINDRAYTRKAWKLLKEINESHRFSEDERTLMYTLRDKNGLLHSETCTKEALVTTYKDFAKYFEKKYSAQKGRLRYIDFNQGVDARLFTEERVKLLSQIQLRPLRIAFDNVKTESEYTKAVRMSVAYGMKDFSNYLLYNFDDEPIDLYRRLRINVDLCEELNVSIYSFPMKYHPIRNEHSHDRDFIGVHWNRKYIRAVQAILNATKGKVGRGEAFFEKAFGKDEKEYMELLLMPETFLLFRLFFEHLGYTQAWREAMEKLTDAEKEELYPIIFRNDFNNIEELTTNEKFRKILACYKNYRGDIADPKSELYRLKKEFDKTNTNKEFHIPN